MKQEPKSQPCIKCESFWPSEISAIGHCRRHGVVGIHALYTTCPDWKTEDWGAHKVEWTTREL